MLESVGDDGQQAQALKDLCESKAKQAVAKAAGYAREEEVEVALFQQEQRKKMLGRASATTKLKGRVQTTRGAASSRQTSSQKRHRRQGMVQKSRP